MRILSAAAFILTASTGVQASSILVVDDNRQVQGNSVSTIKDGSEIANSPSVVVIGTSESAEAQKSRPGVAASDPLVRVPLPMVIRAGIEGEAFTRALAPDGNGTPTEAATPAETKVPAGAVSTPVAPRAAVDPAAQPPVAGNAPASAEPMLE